MRSADIASPGLGGVLSVADAAPTSPVRWHGTPAAHISVFMLKGSASAPRTLGLTTSQPITTAIHPRSRSLVRSSQSFVVLVNGTVPCCQLAPRQPPLVLFADIHACSLEYLDQSGISTDFGHSRNEDCPHFSIAWFCRVEAYDQITAEACLRADQCR